MIEFIAERKRQHVRVDGRPAGEIFATATGDGFYYKPRGGKPGETFRTIEACQHSLLDDTDED